jgi:two-component system, cell cycle response regulator
MATALAHPTTRRITAALLACALVVYAVQVFAHNPFGATVDSVLYDGLLFAGALVCLARVVANPSDRLAWGLVGGGLLAWAAADVYNTLVLSKLDEPPYPSLADAGWLIYYPTSYVAVLLLARRRDTRVPAGVWLDGVVASLACAALTSALLFEPILSAAVEGATAAIVTNLAYPVGDLLLLLLIVAVLGLTGWRPGRMWLVFAAGLAASAIADSWYLADTAKGTYAEGGVLDILWPLSALLIGWAAWQPRRARDLQLEGARLVVVPIAASLAALGLTFYDHFVRINTVSIGLATATLIVAVVRMGLAFVANARMLGRSRHEAVTDALTGLGNRRALMSDLELSMSGEDTLVLFDLDGFKRYNDTFGHPAGDALLQRLGGKLTKAVDGHGRAYRMGGDEFCVLLHDRADGAVAAAATALSESGRGFMIGASHGLVVPAVEATSAAEALQIADHRMYEHKAGRSAARTSETRDVLMRILRERQPELHDHLNQVADLARATGRGLGLMREALDEIARAAELHDIGKMAVPDAILDKPGPLDEDEWAFMRRHTLIGESILSASPALVPVAKLVRSSHESFDGTGYPDGKAGNEIPLGARIVAVCDAYDAMTSDRAYRRAMSSEGALEELRRASGTQFDPDVVEAFISVVASPLPTDEEERGEGSADERLRAAARAGRPAGPGATAR